MNRQHSKPFIRLTALLQFLVFLLLAGSTAFAAPVPKTAPAVPVAPAIPEKPPVATASLYPMGNYDKVKLENRHYEGKLFVEAYHISVTGVPGTVIEGGLYILANHFTMTGVTVNGPVAILGSNANLTGCKIDGKVTSRGANNRW